MIKVENKSVWGFEGAIRGMRNPMNSWGMSDSVICTNDCYEPVKCDERETGYCIGLKDLKLMANLLKAGTEHRKYLRMIHVQMDITAPLYWWKEFDTYKVGTTANSCSTMHKIAAKEFELDDFSHDRLDTTSKQILGITIEHMNIEREMFLKHKDKHHWWHMIQLLPSSYNQRRTVDMNYETVLNIIRQRTGHKLDEWNTFVTELRWLPYMKELLDLSEVTE